MTPLPPGQDDERQQQQRAMEQRMQERLAGIDRRIVVLSGKGGVGKSTVAANLALALGAAGRRTGILDVDVHGPSIPRLLGLGDRQVEGVGDIIIPLPAEHGLRVMSMGLLMPRREEAVIWRGPMKYGAIRQFLADVEWGPLDFLVVDAPPGTGDEPLGVIQLLGRVDGAVLVTTPQELAVADVRRCLTFCRRLEVPVLGILENMSGMVCPHCGEVVDVFKQGGGKALAEETGVPFLGRIPLDPDLARDSDDGIPFLSHHPEAPAARAFREAIQPILDMQPGKDNSQA